MFKSPEQNGPIVHNTAEEPIAIKSDVVEEKDSVIEQEQDAVTELSLVLSRLSLEMAEHNMNDDASIIEGVLARIRKYILYLKDEKEKFASFDDYMKGNNSQIMNQVFVGFKSGISGGLLLNKYGFNIGNVREFDNISTEAKKRITEDGGEILNGTLSEAGEAMLCNALEVNDSIGKINYSEHLAQIKKAVRPKNFNFRTSLPGVNIVIEKDKELSLSGENSQTAEIQKADSVMLEFSSDMVKQLFDQQDVGS